MSCLWSAPGPSSLLVDVGRVLAGSSPPKQSYSPPLGHLDSSLGFLGSRRQAETLPVALRAARSRSICSLFHRWKVGLARAPLPRACAVSCGGASQVPRWEPVTSAAEGVLDPPEEGGGPEGPGPQIVTRSRWLGGRACSQLRTRVLHKGGLE